MQCSGVEKAGGLSLITAQRNALRDTAQHIYNSVHIAVRKWQGMMGPLTCGWLDCGKAKNCRMEGSLAGIRINMTLTGREKCRSVRVSIGPGVSERLPLGSAVTV